MGLRGRNELHLFVFFISYQTRLLSVIGWTYTCKSFQSFCQIRKCPFFFTKVQNHIFITSQGWTLNFSCLYFWSEVCFLSLQLKLLEFGYEVEPSTHRHQQTKQCFVNLLRELDPKSNKMSMTKVEVEREEQTNTFLQPNEVFSALFWVREKRKEEICSHCGLQWHTVTSNWSRYKRQVFFFFFAGLLWIAILIIRSKIWKVFHFANVFPAFSRFSRHGKSCFGRKKNLTLWGNCFFPQNKSQAKPKDAKPEIHHKKFSVCDSEMSLTAGPWIEFQPNNTFTVLC